MDKHTISFRNAFRGLITAFTTQLNLRIHLSIGTIVTAVGLFFELSINEWLVIALTIAMVVVAELNNTAVEFACNAITREQNIDIKHAKDTAAGAVLFAAAFSVIVGFLIFWPKIINIWIK